MKNTLKMIMATGGMFLMTSSDAQAQSWRAPQSGFGVSLNLGNAGYRDYGYRGSYRNIDPRFDQGWNRGYGSGYGYGQLPISYGHNYGRSRYSGYNSYRLPPSRYVAPRRSYGYGCRYGY